MHHFRLRLAQRSRPLLVATLLATACAAIVALAAHQQWHEQARADARQSALALAQRLAVEAAPALENTDRLRLQATVNAYRTLPGVNGAALLDAAGKPLAETGPQHGVSQRVSAAAGASAVLHLSPAAPTGSGLALLVLLLGALTAALWRALQPWLDEASESPGEANVHLELDTPVEPALLDRLEAVYGGQRDHERSGRDTMTLTFKARSFTSHREGDDHGFRALCCATLLLELSPQPLQLTLRRGDEPRPPIPSPGLRLSPALAADPVVGGRCRLEDDVVGALRTPYAELLEQQSRTLRAQSA